MKLRSINFACNEDKIGEFLSSHTMLQWVFFYACWYIGTRFGKIPLITCVKTSCLTGDERTAPEDVHAHGRGLDIDVCDGFVYQGGLLPHEAQEIVDVINLGFVYDPNRMDRRVAIYGENDKKGRHWNHIHFQVCWGDRSRCL